MGSKKRASLDGQEANVLFSVLDHVGDVIALVDDGRVVRANRAWWELLGRGPKREERPLIADLVHHEDGDKLADVSAGADVELRLVTRSRSVVKGRLHVEPFGAGGFIYVVRDLGEAYDLAKIEPARVALAVLRDACDISLWRWDPDTQDYIFDLDFSRPTESYKVADAPELSRSRRLTGASTSEAVSGLVHPDDADRVRESFTRTVTDGRVELIEYRRQRPNGSWAHLRCAWRGTRPTPKGWEVLGLTLDVSELAEARNAALAAAQAKSQFLANMSHEIRTPMNGIIGMTSLLLRGDLTQEQKKFAEAVRISSDALLGIINDILDISKLEAGKVELESIDFSLETLVEDVVELMSPRAAEKSLEIGSCLDDGAREPLRGDPTRVRQVLLNLVSNALKFTERGFVAIEVRSRRGRAGRTFLSVEVQDTGIGLTPEAKGKLFQTFSQADGSVTRKYGGTGLGLAICRQLTTLMGGEISVKDRPGGGSIFWFALELEAAEAAPGACASRRKNLRGLRVLVVDDIELNRNIFVRQLQADGASADEAESGAAALRKLGEAQAVGRPYDIVLLDYMMPQMSGELVARAIRSDAGLIQPRVVLASSIDAPVTRDHGSELGIDAVLIKPVRHQALIDCLAGLAGEPRMQKSVTKEDEPSNADQPTASAPAALGHVLLAEDNEINTFLARTILEAAGFTVASVVNGREAVEAVRCEAFDLVLMDVHMPETDGLTATRMIRELEGTAGKVLIVAMTANAMRSDHDECLAAGMDDFVSKPFEAEAFLGVVGRVLASRDDVAPSAPEKTAKLRA